MNSWLKYFQCKDKIRRNLCIKQMNQWIPTITHRDELRCYKTQNLFEDSNQIQKQIPNRNGRSILKIDSKQTDHTDFSFSR